MSAPFTLENPQADQFFQSLNHAGGASGSPAAAPLSSASNSQIKSRKRSNSKSRRVISHTPPPPPTDRARVQYTVVLASLNGTFEKKSLVIPYHPDVLKLGRPAGTKIQPTPTNGYFDSRVLSRNHAQLFADMHTGKIYLKDLGSSNGTFVNEEKIASDKDAEPTEIHKGDIIDLGFDIESHQNHRKISARVETILVRALAEGNISSIVESGSQPNGLIELEEDVKRQIMSNSFDCALFGDILPGFEDTLLGIRNDSMTGLSINSNLTTSGTLDLQIKTLINEIYLTKSSILRTKSIEVFLRKYIKNLNKIEVEKNEANKNKVKDYEQQLARKYEKEYLEKKSELDKKLLRLSELNKSAKIENENLIQVVGELNDKASKLGKTLEEERELYKSLKSETDEKSTTITQLQSELTQSQIKIEELKQSPQYLEKSVQTEPIRKYKHIINDNDSDSSTLNDEGPLDLQRLQKSLNARNGNENYSSNLKSAVVSRNDDESECEEQQPKIEAPQKSTIASSSSDEDLNLKNDRNNIITDEKMISEDEEEKDESDDIKQHNNISTSPLPSPTIHSDTTYSNNIEQSSKNDLLKLIENLQKENESIKSNLYSKDQQLVSLESQLKQQRHWDEHQRPDSLLLSRSPSNISINSAVSSGTSVSNFNSQSPIFGIFGSSFRMRPRNPNTTDVSSIDLEDSLLDIDNDEAERVPKSPGKGVFLKSENTKTSLVTAVGIVMISLMVSKISHIID